MTPASPSQNAGDFLFHSFRRHRPQRGKHRFCLLPLPLPGISPALSIRQTFQVFNLERASSSTDCQTTYSPSACMPARTGMHYHRRPSAKAKSARKRFSARLPVLPAFISQNLRIILTHNHRRRCGNDFIADAWSARFPQIFCQIFNR